MNRTGFLAVAGLVAAGALAAVFLWPKEKAVTVYCAADDVHALPILQAFAAETGIRVHWQFDTEASKTVGLVERIRSERGRPQCDVFWNNEPLHSMRLAEEGFYDVYRSPSAADIPDEFKDPEGRWTGFAARGRILIVNTKSVSAQNMPQSMDDLVDPKWKQRAVFSKPLAGTALTHVAVLYSLLGAARTEQWLRGLRANDVGFPSGNAPAATSVAEGVLAFGFTDTDDFRKCQAEEKPVAIVYPDQAEGRPGTLVLPNTVGILKGCPEPALAREFVDYLLRPEVESKLAHSDGAHIPLRASAKRPAYVQGPPQFRAMKVDWRAVLKDYDASLALIRRVIGE